MEPMDHLQGVRCIMAFWIVSGHYMPLSSASIGFGLNCRAFVAVDVFVAWAKSLNLYV